MKNRPNLKFTPKQKDFYSLLRQKTFTIGVGPSGVGKTLISLFYAWEQLDMGERDEILYCKPDTYLRGGLRRRGTLPGTQQEKDEPLLAPVLDNLRAFLIPSKIQDMLYRNKLQFVYPEDIRGRSLNNSTLIVDECQNLPPEMVLAFLTRVGKNSSVILLGDPEQIDNPHTTAHNGLTDATHRLQGLEEVGITRFGLEDIVRNNAIAKVIERYRDLTRDLPNFSNNGHHEPEILYPSFA